MVERRYVYWDDSGQELKEAGAGDTPAGLNRDQTQRDTLLSTNSTTYVNYLTLNYVAEATGEFQISAELIWNTNRANRDVAFEINIDGIQDEEVLQRLGGAASQLRIPTTQIHLVNLTAGAHTIEINVRVENASQTLDVFHGDLFVQRWDV
jgi:hypothetical protein